MNTNIVLSLDQRRAKKDGTFPLVMRLGHNERTTSIPTGISLLVKDWNAKDRKVKPSYAGVSSVTRLNNMLQKQKADAMDVILKLEEAGQLQSFSLADLRDRLSSKSNRSSFFSYAETLIEGLREANRFGTALWYKGSCAVLKSFVKDKDLAFQEINHALLTKFENQHLGKGNSYNSLSVYLRAIRAIYKKAITERLVSEEFYPFREYKIKKEPTRKRALPWEYLKKIVELDLAPRTACFRARQYFLASYMTYGMNFIDMAFLKKSHIVNGRIQYQRSKTSRLFDIKIIADLDKILSYYIAQNPESEYVFPILKSDTPLEQYREMKEARKRYNKNLKELAKLCGIETNLTSYVGRHSFATQLRRQNVPVDVISAMLGHGSVATTEIYLESLPTQELDDYNERILMRGVTEKKEGGS